MARSGISRKQQSAIAALLREKTVVDAAHSAGVSVRSLYRWLNEPAFQKAHEEARHQLGTKAMAQLQRLLGKGTDRLEGMLDDAGLTGHAKLRAIQLALEYGIKAIDRDVLEQRIVALEALFAREAGDHGAEVGVCSGYV